MIRDADLAALAEIVGCSIETWYTFIGTFNDFDFRQDSIIQFVQKRSKYPFFIYIYIYYQSKRLIQYTLQKFLVKYSKLIGYFQYLYLNVYDRRINKYHINKKYILTSLLTVIIRWIGII